MRHELFSDGALYAGRQEPSNFFPFFGNTLHSSRLESQLLSILRLTFTFIQDEQHLGKHIAYYSFRAVTGTAHRMNTACVGWFMWVIPGRTESQISMIYYSQFALNSAAKQTETDSEIYYS
jgi:hypothetical protein